MLEEVGFEQMTIRIVAGRAGVTHTTAYTYFSSKDHLVAAAFLRVLRELPAPPTDAVGTPADRVVAGLGPVARALGPRPALAQAALAALLV